MQSSDADRIIFRQPLWIRLAVVLGAVALVGIGVLMLRDGEYLMGGLCIVFFGLAGVVALRKSRVALIADREGIVPAFVLPKGSTVKIPWSKVDKLIVANQTIGHRYGSQTYRHLGIYLNDPTFLDSLPFMQQASAYLTKASGGVGLDDRGAADIYIPALALGCSPQKAIERMESLRGSEVRSENAPK